MFDLRWLGWVAVLCAGCAEDARSAPIRDESVRSTSSALVASATPSATARPDVSARDWFTTTFHGTPVAPWLERAEAHRVQILVRAVTATGFVEHAFRVDAEYVYPASAIKTFLSVAALRALKARAGSPFETNPLADVIGRLQRVSDNAAFGELYDFVGHEELNQTWWQLGFRSVRFHHRMGGTRAEGLKMPAVTLLVGEERLHLAARHSELSLPATDAKRVEVGNAHRLRTTRVVKRPMSFADKNYVSLRDLQRLNISLIHPRSKEAVALGLDVRDRALLLAAMTEKTTDAEQHKPLLAGVRRVIDDEHIRYVGKSGRAYGFHVANAFIENSSSGGALYVTASIYVNPNGVMNDDVYDYEGSTQPFMTALGEALAATLLK